MRSFGCRYDRQQELEMHEERHQVMLMTPFMRRCLLPEVVPVSRGEDRVRMPDVRR